MQLLSIIWPIVVNVLACVGALTLAAVIGLWWAGREEPPWL